jgi:hypothetical protein
VVRLPREITPAAAARRALLGDLTAAVVLAAIALLSAAGVGVVAVIAIGVLFALTLWLGAELLLRRLRR